jgi:hypothetical protein
MSMKACRSELATLTRNLQLHWNSTRGSWRDGKSEAFAQRYLAPLETCTATAVTAIAQLDELISRIRMDCD